MNDSVHLGDCLSVLRYCKSDSVDVIHLDPPFYSQRKHSGRGRKDSVVLEFDDIWPDLQSYIQFMRERLFECQRVLKSTGSIFLHCDRSASHHLRVLLDEVFGAKRFESEIIWAYRRWSNSKRGLLNAHQVIFFYSKTSRYKFFPAYDEYSPTTNLDQIFQKRTRGVTGKSEYKESNDGLFELVERKKGVPLSDVWNIPYLNPKAKERVGYPTQKPILLLERIICLVSEPGDIVLDPFCGSGTTLVAAKLLGRSYVGIDVSPEAVRLSNERLQRPVRTESALLKRGIDSYRHLPDEISDLLHDLGVQSVQRNAGIDGFLKAGENIYPIPLRVQRVGETVDFVQRKILESGKRQGFSKCMVLVLEPSVLEERWIDSMQVVLVSRDNFEAGRSMLV